MILHTRRRPWLDSLGLPTEFQIVYPANGQVMMSHPRGVEMFSSSKVYSPRVLHHASQTGLQILLPASGHELAPRFMTCVLGPTSSNMSVLQLSRSVVAGSLLSQFSTPPSRRYKKVSSTHTTPGFPISDSLMHGRLLDGIVPSHDGSRHSRTIRLLA